MVGGKGDKNIDLVPNGIISCPPIPLDINELRFGVALSRSNQPDMQQGIYH